MIAVCVRQACKTSPGGDKVLDELDMTVPSGVIYGLLGPSGCGKTTLLGCLVGRLRVDSGEVRVMTKSVGLMPQEVALCEDLTVAECATYFGWLAGVPCVHIRQRLEFLSRLLMLHDVNVPIRGLSGGTKRRASLAVALVPDPMLLLLDEPTAGLDPVVREVVWQHLVFLTEQRGVTVVLTSHYVEEARRAHIVGLMRDGYLTIEASPSQLMRKLGVDTLEEASLKMRAKARKRPAGNEPTSQSHVPTPKTPGIQRFKAVLWKNVLWMWRNMGFVACVAALPAVLIALFCASYGHDPSGVVVAVVDRGESDLSVAYVEMLRRDGSFDLVWCHAEDQADEMVRRGSAHAAVVVSSTSDDPVKLDVFRDESVFVVDAHVRKTLVDAYSELMNVTTPIAWKPPIYGFKNAELTDFASPGITLTLIFVFAAATSACSLLVERTEGVLDRSLAMGVRGVELLLAHVVCDVTVLVLQVILVMACGFALRRSLHLVFSLCFLAGLCGTCFGFALAGALDDETAAVHVITGLATPLVLLSGVVWPAQAMQKTLRSFASVFPLTVATESLRSVLQRGWGLNKSGVYTGFVYLGAVSGLLFVCSVMSLKLRKGY